MDAAAAVAPFIDDNGGWADPARFHFLNLLARCENETFAKAKAALVRIYYQYHHVFLSLTATCALKLRS